MYEQEDMQRVCKHQRDVAVMVGRGLDKEWPSQLPD